MTQDRRPLTALRQETRTDTKAGRPSLRFPKHHADVAQPTRTAERSRLGVAARLG